MPSRHSRKAKSTINSYDEKKTQRPLSNSKVSAHSTPTINVTDASPPDLILHSSWKVLYIFQFLTLFRHQLNLPSITIDELESLLVFRPMENENVNNDHLSAPDQTYDDINISNNNNHSRSITPSSRESSVVDATGTLNEQQQRRSLAKLLVPILTSLFDDKKHKTITDINYPQHIYSYLYHRSVEEDVQEILGRYDDKIDFATLTLLDKICILKELIDSVFETGKALHWKNNMQPEEMRASSIGKDSGGWTYYVFGEFRLYREIAISPRKKETDYTFELIATTQEEWQTWMNKFSLKSSKAQERSLAQELQTHGAVIVQKFETRKAAKLREEAKLEKAKKLDMLPRKRSRRIEVKSEEDDRRRQLEELERAQLEYEEIQREQERKEQEELAEREKQAMSVEDARLKEQVYQLLDRMVTDYQHSKRLPKEPSANCDTSHLEEFDDDRINQLKYLRTKLKKSATYDEALEKLTGWATLLDGNCKVVTNMKEPIWLVEENGDNQEQNQEPRNDRTQMETAEHYLDNATVIEKAPASDNTNSSHQSALDESTLPNMGTMSPTAPHLLPQELTSNSTSTLRIEQSTNGTSNNSYQPSIPVMSSDPEKPMVQQLTEQPTPVAQQMPSTVAEQQAPSKEPSHSSPRSDKLLEKTCESIATGPATSTVDATQQAPNAIESTVSSNANSPNSSKKAHPTSKRGRPRKPRKPILNTTALFPSFSDALCFTGNGTRSDIQDPLLKLILSTMMTQIRQHPIIAGLEQRNEKKTGKKRKTAITLTAMTFYTIHKKLLLNEYGGTDGNENVTDTPDANQARTSFEEGSGSSAADGDMEVTTKGTSNAGTVDGETKDSIMEGGTDSTSTNLSVHGPSGFDLWLKDMDLILKANDTSSLELKLFTYDMFRLVFTNEKLD